MEGRGTHAQTGGHGRQRHARTDRQEEARRGTHRMKDIHTKCEIETERERKTHTQSK